MFSALSVHLDVSLYSYAACAGRRTISGSFTLRDALLAERRPAGRRLQHTRSAAARQPRHKPCSGTLLERSYTTSSDDSQSSSASGESSASSAPSTSSSGSHVQPQASPVFQFLLSVSFLGKPAHEDDPTSFSFTFSENSPIKQWRDARLLQDGRPWKGKGKASQEPDAGDDFWFMSKQENNDAERYGIPSHNAAFGVADGVGGWAESDVDPGIFSSALMYHAQKATERLREKQDSQLYPHDVLKRAYDAVLGEKEVVAGSSTATILSLDGQKGWMRAANLGDSAFALLRSDKVVHQQPAQQHYFNCPFQLSKLPKSMQGRGNIVDEASQADLFEARLEDGDLIIAFTDGFSDNVFMREVEVLLARLRDQKEYNVGDGFEQEYVDRVADSLVSYAKLCSEKEDKQSPFELEAKKNRMRYKGGKVDDICVAVALVKQIN